MSHTLHGRPHTALSGLNLTVKLALVALLLAAALVGRLLTDDNASPTPAPSASAAMVAHPEEGSAAIAVPVTRPEEGTAAIR